MFRIKLATAAAIMFALLVSGCDEGTNDWNSSAKISGYVYTNAAHTQGLSGVQVILEGDPNADTPYEGPDRWTVSNSSGYFEGFLFLGNEAADDEEGYIYVGDVSVAYFWHDKSFRWTGGITIGPGSHFTLPGVDTTMFQ